MNQQFENFLKNCVAKKQQPSLVRLKVLQRQGLLNSYNSMVRGGSSLSLGATPVCEKERAIEAFKNLMATFRSSSSSTFA